MYKFLRTFMHSAKNVSSSMERQVGRWSVPNRPNSPENATLIADRSNVDHCGGCGDNLLHPQTNTINSKNEWKELSEDEIYYYPYTM